MTPRPIALTRLALLLAVVPTATLAQQTQTGAAAITIERSLDITAIRPLSFSAVVGATGDATVASPAVIDITGDPGRIYRLRLPETITVEDSGAVVDRFTITSATSGDVTNSLTARMNSEGRDRLSIVGRLRHVNGIVVTNVFTAIPVSVDYE